MKNILLFFALFPLFLRGEWDHLFPGGDDPFFVQHVSMYTGSLNLYFQDALVRGPLPLDLSRSYSSSIAANRKRSEDKEVGNRLSQYGMLSCSEGWSILPHTIALLNQKRDYLETFEPHGTAVVYQSKEVDNPSFEVKGKVSGFRYYGSLSGRIYPKNHLARWNPKKKRGEILLASGGQRFYKKTKWLRNFLKEEKFYHLKEEVLPSKHRMVYKYDDQGLLSRVALKNPKGTKTYSWLQFNYKSHTPPFDYTITTSDGNVYHYEGWEFKHRDHLHKITRNGQSVQSYDYTKIGKGGGLAIAAAYHNDEPTMAFEYIKKGSDKENPAKGARRVKKVFMPVGDGGEMVPIADFEYKEGETLHIDLLTNRHTRYVFTGTRPLRIQYKDQGHGIYCQQVFKWNGDQLISKEFQTEEGRPVFRKTFAYDDYQNVTEETIFGKITGEGKGGKESLTHRYFYDGTTHLLMREEQEEGLTYEYTYFADTDLLASKTTKGGGEVYKREEFFYNDDHFLVEQVEEEGGRRFVKKFEIDDETGLQRAVETYASSALINRVEFSYDEHKQVIREDIFDGKRCWLYALHTEYDGLGRITCKTNPLGQKSLYEYDSVGHLISSQEAGGHRKRFTYDAAGRVTEVECEGEVTRTVYDAVGNVIVSMDSFGRETKYEYDEFNRPIKTIFPDGSETKKTYNIQGYVASETNQNGETTYMKYNIFGSPTRILYPDGSLLYHSYTKRGLKKATHHQDGSKTLYEYDPLKRLTKKIFQDRSGQVLYEENWVYKGMLLAEHTNHEGITTHYSYNERGELVEERTEERVKRYTYDALGNLERVYEGEGCHVKLHDFGKRVIAEWDEDLLGHKENEITYRYDAFNQKIEIVKKTSAGLACDEIQYDAQGRIRQHRDPYGALSTFSYTPTVTITIDPSSNKTEEHLDLLDRLVARIKYDSASQEVSREEWTYDAAGQTTKWVTYRYTAGKKGNPSVVEWVYNSMGRVIKEIEQGKKKTEFRYDVLGNLVEKHLPSGVILIYTYDPLGRLVNLFSRDHSIQYTYDYEGASSLPTRISDGKIEVRRTYSPYGEILSETRGEQSYSWTYDQYGRKTRFILPDKSQIAYFYRGRHMEKVVRLNAEQEKLYEHLYLAFDSCGHVTQETLLTRERLETKRDLLERPYFSKTPMLTQSLTYTKEGLISCKKSSLFGDKHFAYDALHQLKKEGEISYSFDSLGNPTLCTLNALNQITQTPDCEIFYDDNGNPIRRLYADHSVDYTYDALNQLTSITTKTRRVVYTYDPLSRLYSKKTYTRYGRDWTLISYERFLYDQEYEIGMEDELGFIQQLKVVGLAHQGDIGGAVAIEMFTYPFAPLHDLTGNIVALLTSDGDLQETYDFDAFGRPSRPYSCANPWGFASKRSEEDLIFFGLRFYDPQLLRWLTPDPAGFIDGPNLYTFVHNAPTTRLDALGLYDDYYNNFKPPTFSENYNTGEIYPVQFTMGSEYFDGAVSGDILQNMRYNPSQGAIDLTGRYTPSLWVNIPQPSDTSSPNIPFILYGNGINTSYNEFLTNCHYLSQGASVSFIGIYNRSEGLRQDIHSTFRDKQASLASGTNPYLHTDCSRIWKDALTHMSQSYLRNNPWAHPLIMPHSRGGAICAAAIGALPSDALEIFKKQVHYRGIGSAQPLRESYALSVIDFYSDKDRVTGRYGKQYSKYSDYNIKFVQSITPATDRSFITGDHALLLPTYLELAREQINDLFKEYNPQNKENR